MATAEFLNNRRKAKPSHGAALGRRAVDPPAWVAPGRSRAGAEGQQLACWTQLSKESTLLLYLGRGRQHWGWEQETPLKGRVSFQAPDASRQTLLKWKKWKDSLNTAEAQRSARKPLPNHHLPLWILAPPSSTSWGRGRGQASSPDSKGNFPNPLYSKYALPPRGAPPDMLIVWRLIGYN